MTPSPQPSSIPASRRALLAGALGGIGAWALAATGRVSPARAEGEVIHVGDEFTTATSRTRIVNQANSADVLAAESAAGGIGVLGHSDSYLGVRGSSNVNTGVYGLSNSGYGVNGYSGATGGAAAGVYGEAPNRYGVEGRSVSDAGVRGGSTDFLGVYGQSATHDGILGVALAARRGVHGESAGGTAVYGFSGAYLTGPAVKLKTGVYGRANQNSDAKGVWGDSPKGRGIQGSSSSGYAGYFSGRVYTTAWYELTEISNPAAPANNRARLFIRDNGSGKTQLCVRYATGSVQVLNTQP